MPNKNIFCNVPWYELHIYWDGSFGICCVEDHKLYDQDNARYNIATMSIKEWYNSEPATQFRQAVLADKKLSACRSCYLEELHGGHSRRYKENQKSAIFTQAFDQSFEQSPGHLHFLHSAQTQGITDTLPIDLHVNLGNYCNLACKMCAPSASSTIAAQQVKWGITQSRRYVGVDWTKDSRVWNSFKAQILDLPSLKNIHFMGGETLLTDQFENFVDTMIQHQRFDLCLSFVTNGTVIKPDLLNKLKLFARVGIEVSIETLTQHNAYTRQGTDTNVVVQNIERYQDWCNGSTITVTLRPAPSLLTIGYYPTLLQYALNNQLLVKSNLCYRPKFLYAVNLPSKVKTLYAEKYHQLLTTMSPDSVNIDFNASDPKNFEAAIKQEAQMCLDLLTSPEPNDIEQQLALMVDHCKRWDSVYQLNARTLYPELAEVWDRYAY